MPFGDPQQLPEGAAVAGIGHLAEAEIDPIRE
jgi:hypothetical protein